MMERVPPLMKLLYPEWNVFHLNELLQKWHLEELEFAHDPPEYKDFLKTSIVACPRGFQFRSSGCHYFTSQAPRGLSCHAGASFDHLPPRLAWNLLASRIGEKSVKYLVKNTSVFIQVESSNFIQISGVPVYKLPHLTKQQPRKRQKGSTENSSSLNKEKKNVRKQNNGSKAKSHRGNCEKPAGAQESRHGTADVPVQCWCRPFKARSSQSTCCRNTPMDRVPSGHCEMSGSSQHLHTLRTATVESSQGENAGEHGAVNAQANTASYSGRSDLAQELFGSRITGFSQSENVKESSMAGVQPTTSSLFRKRPAPGTESDCSSMQVKRRRLEPTQVSNHVDQVSLDSIAINPAGNADVQMTELLCDEVDQGQSDAIHFSVPTNSDQSDANGILHIQQGMACDMESCCTKTYAFSAPSIRCAAEPPKHLGSQVHCDTEGKSSTEPSQERSAEVVKDRGGQEKCQLCVSDDSLSEMCRNSRGRKRRRKARKKEKTPSLPPDFKPYQYHKLLPRKRMMYSRCLRERFPPTYVLSKRELSVTDCATQLFDVIFTRAKVTSSGLPSSCCCEKCLGNSLCNCSQNRTSQSSNKPLTSLQPAVKVSKRTFGRTKIKMAKVSVDNVEQPAGLQKMNRRVESEISPLSARERLSAAESGNPVSTSAVENAHAGGEAFSAECSETDGEDNAQKELSCCFKAKVLPLLKDMISRHRRFRYYTALNHYCLPKTLSYGICRHKVTHKNVLQRSSKRNDAKPTSSGKGLPCWNSGTFVTLRKCYRCTWKRQRRIGQLLEDFVSHRQVFLFLRLAVLVVVPQQFFGSRHNQNVFLKRVRDLVSMGRFDRLCLGQLLRGVKLKAFDWLACVRGNAGKALHLAKLLWWIMGDFVMQMIRTFFYLTDTTTYRNRLFYYRKCVWHKITRQGLETHSKQVCLVLRSKEQVQSMLASGKSLGVTQLRFLPKCSSLRPILNLSQPQVSQTKKMGRISVNRQLRDLHDVLSFHCKTRPELLGASVFGLDDVHRRWSRFVQQMPRPDSPEWHPLYFVKVDILRCFDSISLKKLEEIIKEVMGEDNEEDQQYALHYFCSIFKAGDQICRAFHRSANPITHPLQDRQDFARMVQDQLKEKPWHHRVFVDQNWKITLSSRSLLKVLHAHLYGNIVKVNSQHYLLQRGISQGSVLSTLLCNLYYAAMEREVMLPRPGELLMRMVDDFLLVTPSRPRASAFLHCLMQGIPEYNCLTNPEKVLVNFDPDDPEWPDIAKVKAGGLFPWCGLLLDTGTLEIRGDYSSYASVAIADTLTFDLGQQAGQRLQKTLLWSLMSRCQAVFVDPNINSRATVLLNMAQTFLLLAAKFQQYVRRLPASSGVDSNPDFFLKVILSLADHYRNSVMRKCSGTSTSHGRNGSQGSARQSSNMSSTQQTPSSVQHTHSSVRYTPSSAQQTPNCVHHAQSSVQQTVDSVLQTLSSEQQIRWICLQCFLLVLGPCRYRSCLPCPVLLARMRKSAGKMGRALASEGVNTEAVLSIVKNAATEEIVTLL